MGCCGKIVEGVIGLYQALADPEAWAPGDITVARRAICKPCENRLGPVCRLCNCVIQAKTRLKDQKCPDGKWSEVPYVV